jgi:hypothetical protein
MHDERYYLDSQPQVEEDLTVPEGIKVQQAVVQSDNPLRYRWWAVLFGPSELSVEKSLTGWSGKLRTSGLVFLVLFALVAALWLRH